jgi:hypothetical protein
MPQVFFSREPLLAFAEEGLQIGSACETREAVMMGNWWMGESKCEGWFYWAPIGADERQCPDVSVTFALERDGNTADSERESRGNRMTALNRELLRPEREISRNSSRSMTSAVTKKGAHCPNEVAVRREVARQIE